MSRRHACDNRTGPSVDGTSLCMCVCVFFFLSSLYPYPYQNFFSRVLRTNQILKKICTHVQKNTRSNYCQGCIGPTIRGAVRPFASSNWLSLSGIGMPLPGRDHPSQLASASGLHSTGAQAPFYVPGSLSYPNVSSPVAPKFPKGINYNLCQS